MSNNSQEKILFDRNLLDQFDDLNLSPIYFAMDSIIEKISSYRSESIMIFSSQISEEERSAGVIKLFLIGKDSKRQASITIIASKSTNYLQAVAKFIVSEDDKAEINEFHIEVDDFHTFINPLLTYDKDNGITYKYENGQITRSE